MDKDKKCEACRRTPVREFRDDGSRIETDLVWVMNHFHTCLARRNKFVDGVDIIPRRPKDG